LSPWQWTSSDAGDDIDPTEFLFSDYQTTASGAMIDYNVIHAISHNLGGRQQPAPVFPMSVWFATCLRFPSRQLRGTLLECREQLAALRDAGDSILFWYHPRACVLGPEYAAPFTSILHPWQGNYSMICEGLAGEEETVTQLAELGRYGMVAALAAEPRYFHKAYRCLQRRYAQMVPLGMPLAAKCQSLTLQQSAATAASESEIVSFV
jgi:hypothetical protein